MKSKNPDTSSAGTPSALFITGFRTSFISFHISYPFCTSLNSVICYHHSTHLFAEMPSSLVFLTFDDRYSSHPRIMVGNISSLSPCCIIRDYVVPGSLCHNVFCLDNRGTDKRHSVTRECIRREKSSGWGGSRCSRWWECRYEFVDSLLYVCGGLQNVRWNNVSAGVKRTRLFAPS
jgi:hypothetical protein